MSAADPAVPAPTAAVRPARWGLAAKLFAILILLGAVAVLVTGVLGYFRARDALEKAVFNQLTAARQTKARQVETYFRTIRNELRLLATSKMVVDATREFRDAVDELDRADVPPELRQKVGDWYDDELHARDAPRPGQGAERRSDYLPVGAAALLSAVPLHRRQSVSEGSAQAGRRRRRRQRLQQAARHLSSADARGGRDASASSTSCWPTRSPAA